MTGYVADLSWKSGARAIEKLDRLRSTMAVNVLISTLSRVMPLKVNNLCTMFHLQYYFSDIRKVCDRQHYKTRERRQFQSLLNQVRCWFKEQWLEEYQWTVRSFKLVGPFHHIEGYSDPSFTPKISTEKCIQTRASCHIHGSLFDSVDAYSCFWNVVNVCVKVGGGLVPRDVVWTPARMGHPMTRMREQRNLSVRILKRVLNYSTSQRPCLSRNHWRRCIGYPENLLSKTYISVTLLKYSPKILHNATFK